VLALRGARLFDGDRLLDDPTVLFDGERVVAAGAPVPEGVEVVDLADATLLPGLIDCHQHLCFNGIGTLEEQVAGVGDDELVARARANGEQALRAGITTLRDLGDRAYLTLDLRDDVALPTIVASGPPLTVLNGHCWYLGGECEGDVGLIRAVDERVDHGCDVVKVMVSGGALTPTFPVWESQFSLAELRAVVERAHQRGLPVAAHCHGTRAIEDAVAAGADTIEHCTFFTDSGRSEPSEKVMKRVAESGAVVSATVGRLDDVDVPPLVKANFEAVRWSRQRLVELGATLVAGTDAGITAAKPHDVLPHAIRDFATAGMAPIEALRALTSTAARAIGLGDRKGRLAAGYDADVLAVRGDPLADEAALRSVAGVWRAGQHVA
jgi:imidazolonepropionase-like amidohydrolase